MRPITTTELDLQFASSISPWWLLPAVALVCAAGYLLFRGQGRFADKRQVRMLMWLRLLLLAALTFLAFRPSVIHRLIRRYPGRILFVLDDSTSMDTPSRALGAAEALRLHRTLRSDEGEPAAGDTPDAVGRRLRGLVDIVRGFQREVDRRDLGETERFDIAAAAQDNLLTAFGEVDELLARLPALPEEAGPVLAKGRAALEDLRLTSASVFAGGGGGAEVYDRFSAQCVAAAEHFFAVQALRDEVAIASGNSALLQQADVVRARTRRALLADAVAAATDTLAGRAGDQSLHAVRLSDGETADLPGLDLDAFLPSAPGRTRISARLLDLATEESKYPLSGLVYVGDGRETDAAPPSGLAPALVRRQVPLVAAGVGAAHEPVDLAVLDIAAPPFAVKDRPVRVRARIKASLPAPTPVTVEVLRGETRVAREETTLGDRSEAVVTVGFPVRETGLLRYRVRVLPVEGEVLPAANNTDEFVTLSREERVRVLLLDWKPRWETRFAINTLRRLDYIDLNAVVVVARPDAQLQRGVAAGAWPGSDEALALYDLVILGDVPPDLLTKAEWEGLERHVTARGKAVCFLAAPGAGEVLPGLTGGRAPQVGDDLLAALRRSTGPTPLSLSEVGEAHPLTRTWRTGLTPGEPAAPFDRPFGQLLFLHEDGEAPLGEAAYVGKGKVCTLRTPTLWRHLNPTMLEAHSDFWVRLVTWAVEAGFVREYEEGEPAMALDRRTCPAGAPLQVWRTGPAGATIEILRDGEVAGEAATEATPAAAMPRAVLTDLPVGTALVRPRGDEDSITSIEVLDDNPELERLARDAEFLEHISAGTGGEALRLAHLADAPFHVTPKEHIEEEESIWRLWDAWYVLTLAAVLLTVEWVWRKLVGLV